MPKVSNKDMCTAGGGLDAAADALLSLAGAHASEMVRPMSGTGTVLGVPIPPAGSCPLGRDEESPTSLWAGLRRPEAPRDPLDLRPSVGGGAEPTLGRGELAPDGPPWPQTLTLPFLLLGSHLREPGPPVAPGIASPGAPQELLPAPRRPSAAEKEAADRRRARDDKRSRPSPQQPQPQPRGEPRRAVAQAERNVNASHGFSLEWAHQSARLQSQVETAWATCAALGIQNRLLTQRVQAQQNGLDGHAQLVRRQSEEHQRRLQRQQETFREQAEASNLLHGQLCLHAEHLQAQLDESHAKAVSLGSQRQKEAEELRAAAERANCIASEAQALEANQKRLAKRRKKENSRLRQKLVEIEKKSGDEIAKLERQIKLNREAFALASTQFHRRAMQEADDAHRQAIIEVLRPPASGQKKRGARA